MWLMKYLRLRLGSTWRERLGPATKMSKLSQRQEIGTGLVNIVADDHGMVCDIGI